MKNTDIKNVYFRNNNASALYWGTSLIWKKEEEKPIVSANTFRGKFADNTTEKDWWFYMNRTKTFIPSECVDPVTGEFSYELPEALTNATEFAAAPTLQRIDKLPDTSNVTSMNLMFYKSSSNKFESVNLDGVNTSKVKDMAYMFNGNCYLKELVFPATFDTSNVTNMQSMFNYFQPESKTLDLSMFNTNRVTNMNCMFTQSLITNLNLGNNWNMSNVTDHISAFDGYGFTNVSGTITGIGKNCNKDFDLHYNSLLTNESAMVFINGLANVTGSVRFLLHSKTYDTLTQEQIATATSKGWTVVRRA